jgi:hypothetical protein
MLETADANCRPLLCELSRTDEGQLSNSGASKATETGSLIGGWVRQTGRVTAMRVIGSNEQSEASSIMSLAQSSIMDRLTHRLDAYYSMFTL